MVVRELSYGNVTIASTLLSSDYLWFEDAQRHRHLEVTNHKLSLGELMQK